MALSRARVTAVRAKAETLAPDLYLEADAKVTQAQRARDRGDEGRALNAWWAGAALYERAAQVAKAAPPPVVTLQGVEVTGETGAVVTRSGNSQSGRPAARRRRSAPPTVDDRAAARDAAVTRRGGWPTRRRASAPRLRATSARSKPATPSPLRGDLAALCRLRSSRS